MDSLPIFFFHSFFIDFSCLNFCCKYQFFTERSLTFYNLTFCIIKLTISKHAPAIQAVIKHAMVPAINARNTTRANAGRRCGARAPIPPNCIPIEPKFANPQRAYIEITSDRS